MMMFRNSWNLNKNEKFAEKAVHKKNVQSKNVGRVEEKLENLILSKILWKGREGGEVATELSTFNEAR